MIKKLLALCLFLTYDTLTHTYDAWAFLITWHDEQWKVLMDSSNPITIGDDNITTKQKANVFLATKIIKLNTDFFQNRLTFPDNNPITAQGIASPYVKILGKEIWIHFIPVKHIILPHPFIWRTINDSLGFLTKPYSKYLSYFFQDNVQQAFTQKFPTSKSAVTPIKPAQPQIPSRAPQSDIGSKLNEVSATINQLKTQIFINN